MFINTFSVTHIWAIFLMKLRTLRKCMTLKLYMKVWKVVSSCSATKHCDVQYQKTKMFPLGMFCDKVLMSFADFFVSNVLLWDSVRNQRRAAGMPWGGLLESAGMSDNDWGTQTLHIPSTSKDRWHCNTCSNNIIVVLVTASHNVHSFMSKMLR